MQFNRSHNERREFYEKRQQKPGNGIHSPWWQVDPGLVAEPVESQDSSSELSLEQSDGQGFQLRSRIQET
jgi:hypothetical protein